MSTIDKLFKLDRLHFYIKNKATGTPDDFAEKMGCCKKTIYNLIDELKEIGADVCYNENLKSFEYNNYFTIEFIVNKKKIIGGKKTIMDVFLLHSLKLSCTRIAIA